MAKAVILKELIDELGLSLHSFEMSIGASNGSIRKVIESNGAISTALFEKIITKYPNISQNWLLTGMGDMFLPATQNTDIGDAPTGRKKLIGGTQREVDAMFDNLMGKNPANDTRAARYTEFLNKADSMPLNYLLFEFEERISNLEEIINKK